MFLVSNYKYCLNGVDYSPCYCFQTASYQIIGCENIAVIEVNEIFQGKIGSIYNEIENFQYIVPEKDTSIPADFLADHRVLTDISLSCFAIGIQKIKINSEAFSSSFNSTRRVEITLCDFTEMSFDFIKGFIKLQELSFDSNANVNLADWENFPPLTTLTTLYIKYSTGLDQWNQFPILVNGLTKIDLSYNDMGNDAMDRIMQWILNSPSANSLIYFHLKKNELTTIPWQLQFFKELKRIYLAYNSISAIDAEFISFFPFADSFETHLDLRCNKLTRFEASSFKKFLYRQADLGGRGIDIYGSNYMHRKLYLLSSNFNRFFCEDLINCEEDLCHLAWLIRDNPNLLVYLRATCDCMDLLPSCTNGTLLSKLNPNGFKHCPIEILGRLISVIYSINPNNG